MLKQLALVTVLIQASIISPAMGHGNVYVPKPEGNGGNYTLYFGGPAGSLDIPELVGKSSYGEC
ncbi:hypothetical protein PHMEG_00024855 [Phytophthora megakarya]|uniref:Glycoside hydrolase n=1 Tax=Phytophthora megakarya TaxID=4795 RepID=A0A225VFY9_9STRA|nr:hypothetical protein PHMEG_00024855 [Phytophthora megakarya]